MSSSTAKPKPKTKSLVRSPAKNLQPALKLNSNVHLMCSVCTVHCAAAREKEKNYGGGGRGDEEVNTHGAHITNIEREAKQKFCELEIFSVAVYANNSVARERRSKTV